MEEENRLKRISSPLLRSLSTQKDVYVNYCNVIDEERVQNMSAGEMEKTLKLIILNFNKAISIQKEIEKQNSKNEKQSTMLENERIRG